MHPWGKDGVQGRGTGSVGPMGDPAGLSGQLSGWEEQREGTRPHVSLRAPGLAMAHPPPCPARPRMLSRDGADGGGEGLGMEGQAGAQPRPQQGAMEAKQGPGGLIPAPQGRQTERAGAGLVMVLRAAGRARRAQDVARPRVPGAGQGGCSGAGDNVGCPEHVDRHSRSHRDSPRPALGVSVRLSTAPPKPPQSSPGRGRLPIPGSPGQPSPGLGLLLAQAGGRQVQGRAEHTYPSQDKPLH